MANHLHIVAKKFHVVTRSQDQLKTGFNILKNRFSVPSIYCPVISIAWISLITHISVSQLRYFPAGLGILEVEVEHFKT